MKFDLLLKSPCVPLLQRGKRGVPPFDKGGLGGIFIAIFFIIFSLSLPTGNAAKTQASIGSPTRAIQDLDDMLDSYILHPKNDEEKKRNADLKKNVLHGTFDIRELCRLALDKNWKDLSSRERDRFVDLMTQLLENKAIFSAERGGGREGESKAKKTSYFITYEGERFLNPDKSGAFVHTFVRIPSENLKISLDYKLTKVQEGWKIYDVIVDDASLVDNYKYQFDKIIKQHGYPDLIHRMEAKLTEIQQKKGGIVEIPPPLPPQPEKKSGCRLVPSS
ncbi:MAG: ABC transporter substrate-binding protein [Deltaproteobacteria bacterium]|nr:ABC transporter substrate-binding protein [Deltaproteobacteria bacterium]